MGPTPEYISFLVRMWSRPGDAGGWLAQVELIPSGQQHFFRSLDDLASFIQKLPPPRGDGKPTAYLQSWGTTLCPDAGFD